jgi:hypothetical protein
MEALLAAGYQLTDYEALVFLPAVVEKAGHNQVGGSAGGMQVGVHCVSSVQMWRQQRCRPVGATCDLLF